MKTLKQDWEKILGNKASKRSQLEKQPYRCILCNDDMVRFAHAGAYAHHMNTIHKFHRTGMIKCTRDKALTNRAPNLKKHIIKIIR